MNRRPRRSGINFIENEKDRNLTYFKRRAGLYKSASDLSTLTGAKVAIVVESESGKNNAYGIPSANPIIDAFLSQTAPPDLPVDGEERARITYLEDELFRLEKEKTEEEKRAKETKARLKEILETSGVAKFVSDKLDDLGKAELSELFRRLVRVQEDINHQVKASNHLEVSGQGDPLSLPFSSSSSWPSQIKMPPRPLPWVPLQVSSQHERSPWAPVLQSSSSQPLVHPPILPLEHDAQSTQPLHHHQAHMMPPPQPNEAHQYGYYLPQAQPPPLPPQVDLDQNYAYAHHNVDFNPAPPPFVDLDQNYAYAHNVDFNPVAPPDDHQNYAYTHNFNFNPVAPPPDQNYAYNHNFNFNPPVAPSQANQNNADAHNFAAYGEPYDGYQVWPPLSPCYEPYFDALSAHLGVPGDDGGQAADGNDDGLHQQADEDWLTMNNLWDYSPFRGENSGDAARN